MRFPLFQNVQASRLHYDLRTLTMLYRRALLLLALLAPALQPPIWLSVLVNGANLFFIALLVDFAVAAAAGGAVKPWLFGVPAWRWMFLSEHWPIECKSSRSLDRKLPSLVKRHAGVWVRAGLSIWTIELVLGGAGGNSHGGL